MNLSGLFTILLGYATLLSTVGCESSQIQETRSVQKPSYLGVIFTEYWKGVRVVEVIHGSPAHDAGFLKGDIILAIDGKPVAGKYSLQADIRSRIPGSQAEIEVTNEAGIRKVRSVTLEEEPEGPILRPH